MSQPSDSLSMSEAQRFLRGCFRFQSETGYSPAKANEFLSELVEGLVDQLGKHESADGPNRFVMIEGDALAMLAE